MFNSLMMLAVEANGVVALRMMKLIRGGRRARREAKLMVSEKIDAAFEATARLMAGASGDEIVDRYRQHVAVNAKRWAGSIRAGAETACLSEHDADGSSVGSDVAGIGLVV
jgi:hypothetical protein